MATTVKKNIITINVSFNITKEENITVTIFLSDFIFWMDLKGRRTRSTFMKPVLLSCANEAAKEEITIKKSRRFQLSYK